MACLKHGIVVLRLALPLALAGTGCAKLTEPPKEEVPKKLNPSDLVLVYDDPRGLLLHRTKTGDRWFATQADPRTQQPQTFELRAQEISQLKVQLAGSPYWVLGAAAPPAGG